MKENGGIRACHCPLSLALNQQTDRTWFIGGVDGGINAFSWGEDKCHVALGDKAERFNRKWENGEKIKPFSFDFPDKAGKVLIVTDKAGKMRLSA
jgi:hypothetical protein